MNAANSLYAAIHPDWAYDLMGALEIQVGGTQSQLLEIVGGGLYVDGDISSGGTKFFNIPHPTKLGKRLVYSAIESPEILLFVRGKNGESLPQHFLDITEPNSLQTITGSEGNWLVSGIRKGYADFDPEP